MILEDFLFSWKNRFHSSNEMYKIGRGREYVILLACVICLLREMLNTVLVSIRSGRLLKLLDVSSSDKVLVTTYGKLQPPLGKHRLKVSFISFR